MQVSAEVKGFFGNSAPSNDWLGGDGKKITRPFSPPPTSTSGRPRPTSRHRKAVDRRNVLSRQPRPGLHLGPMMAGVQDTSPEHPNPPLQAAEERSAFQPPGGSGFRQLRQPTLHQPDVL